MDCGGDEKRIRALFSELSLEDRSRVPQFAHVWTRAQVSSEIDAPRVGRRVWISALVAVAICSLVVWSWYRSTPSAAPDIVNPVIAEAPHNDPVSQPERVQPRRRKNSTRRRTDRRTVTQAALLSSWQSPTQSFLAAPTTVVPKELPQLNQSVKDLESFLPKNNEVMKESNR